MGRFEEYEARKRREYGVRFDPSELHEKFRPFFESGERIRVENGDFIRTGIVGVTTGWKPTFMLKYRSNAYGSSDLLGAYDEVVAVQHGRKYVPVA